MRWPLKRYSEGVLSTNGTCLGLTVRLVLGRETCRQTPHFFTRKPGPTRSKHCVKHDALRAPQADAIVATIFPRKKRPSRVLGTVHPGRCNTTTFSEKSCIVVASSFATATSLLVASTVGQHPVEPIFELIRTATTSTDIHSGARSNDPSAQGRRTAKRISTAATTTPRLCPQR
ncbi:unnamed protein product [Ectocarpus sp. 12 AP-2014]